MKKLIKKLIERLLNIHVYRYLPRGINKTADVKNQLPRCNIEIIFDVGANVGQSTKEFVNSFPYAQIYSFEPVESTFQELKANLKDRNKVHCFRLALGASHGKGKMILLGPSVSYSLLPLRNRLNQIKEETEEVEIESLDNFCRSNDVHKISYLKIDTEGYDLEVLKGADQMLSEKRIDIVQVEASMNPKNTRHVLFEDLKKYLEQRDYFLFGIYEQRNEFPTKEPHLRRTNSVFISENVIKSNKQLP